MSEHYHNTMNARYAALRCQLFAQPRTWLVTGVSGFIGSKLLETLRKLDEVQTFGHDICAGIDETMPRYIQSWSEVSTESLATEIAGASQV